MKNDSFIEYETNIKVIGVGGAGRNAVNYMIENHIAGVEFIVMNTDALSLKNSKANKRVLIGKQKAKGYGAGSNLNLGKAAAFESEEEIKRVVRNADIVFIVCGMGGGTGTGAAPVIAKYAKENGCLAIAICTKPFLFEGPERMENALIGLKEIKEYVDTLIVISNQRVLKIIDSSTSMLDAYREVNIILCKGIQAITEIITVHGNINIDYADIRKILENSGTALMGIGSACGANRALQATRNALQSALLEITIRGATNAIVNFTSSESITAKEMEIAIAEIKNNCSEHLNIIYGTAYNQNLKDELVVTIIATGYQMQALDSEYDDLADEIFKVVPSIMSEKLSENSVPQSKDKKKLNFPYWLKK